MGTCDGGSVLNLPSFAVALCLVGYVFVVGFLCYFMNRLGGVCACMKGFCVSLCLDSPSRLLPSAYVAWLLRSFKSSCRWK